jgi:CO/xanthine dehydrogenase Mo-binding subunit
VAAAVTNAVSAALSSFGVQVFNLPISPPSVWQLIRSSQMTANEG